MRFIFILILFTLPNYVLSFQVKPMVAELQSIGSQSQQTIRVSNTSQNPLTIDISAFDLLINQDGTESLVANEEDFLIIPMTTIIPPGKSQSIIVRYIGEPMLEASKAYRIALEQVSVDFGNEGPSGVGMSVSFRTLFNVVPKDAKAKLAIKSKSQADSDTWNLLLENTGNKYIRLSQAEWVFKQGGNEMSLKGQELSEVLSGKLLLPNSTRKVSIKVPSEFDASQSDLEILF